MSRNRYTVARKSIWYVLRTMLAIVAVVIIALYAFIGAMHVSNIYILVSEGMELRAFLHPQGRFHQRADGIFYRGFHRLGFRLIRWEVCGLYHYQFHL